MTYRTPLLSVAVAGLVLAPAARAESPSSGGAPAAGFVALSSASCDDGRTWACSPGQELVLRGTGLRRVSAVIFLGGPGRRDDLRVRPTATRDDRVRVSVPAAARSGPLRVLDGRGGSRATTSRPVKIVPPPPIRGRLVAGSRQAVLAEVKAQPGAAVSVLATRLSDGLVARRWNVRTDTQGGGEVRWDGTVRGKPAPPGRYALRTAVAGQAAGLEGPGASGFRLEDGLFPIRGRHDLGRSATNGFGGGRGHKGQDMFARCGTPLAAANPGRIIAARYEARAGNYAVIRRSDGQSYVYMHMKAPSLVRVGQTVRTETRSGWWGRRAGPPDAICTSSSGRPPAGTPGAHLSTRFPPCGAGTPIARWTCGSARAGVRRRHGGKLVKVRHRDRRDGQCEDQREGRQCAREDRSGA